MCDDSKEVQAIRKERDEAGGGEGVDGRSKKKSVRKGGIG